MHVSDIFLGKFVTKARKTAPIVSFVSSVFSFLFSDTEYAEDTATVRPATYSRCHELIAVPGSADFFLAPVLVPCCQTAFKAPHPHFWQISRLPDFTTS
jgi:hypothetical protein